MAVVVHDVEQGTPEWLKARMGIPTASEFSTVLARGEGKIRSAYMRKLAGELLTGEPMENYTNADMMRGKAMEEQARDTYAFLTDADLQIVGFITNGPKGCSPDALIGKNGALEIKTAAPHVLIEYILKDDPPPAHKAQTQGVLWVAEREWCDLSIFWPKMPPFIKRIRRDDYYIKELASEVDRFNSELAEMVERIKRYDPPAQGKAK